MEMRVSYTIHRVTMHYRARLLAIIYARVGSHSKNIAIGKQDASKLRRLYRPENRR